MAVSSLLLCLTSHVLANIDTHSRMGVGPGDGMRKEEEQRRETALFLRHVIIVHTEELEKRGQPAPEYGWKRHGETLSCDSHLTPVTKAQEKYSPQLWS